MRVCGSRWRRRLSIVCMYMMCVFCLEYMMTMYRTLSDPDLHVLDDYGLIREVVLEDKAKSQVRNMSRAEVASFMVGANLSLPLNLTNVTSDTWDRAKLHMVQMRLTACVQRQVDMMRCLEDEYIRERVIYLETLKKSRTDATIQKNKSPDEFMRRQKPVMRKITPPATDNPEQVAAYFKRKQDKVCPYKFDAVATPKRDCDKDTFMVILVHSFHPYEDRRQAIRASWGGVAEGRHPWPGRNITHKFKFMFVLGQHTQDHFNVKIANESKEHDDMIIGNFTDAYVNMTQKSLLGLKFVSEHCPNVKYLLKTDDDMVVNLPYLLDILDKKPLNHSIMGPLNVGSKVYRAGKWKVRKEDYPFVYYPPYESGAAYVITNDIVRDLYETAEYVPQFHVDDVYITGVLGKMLGVHHVQQPGFAFWTNRPPSTCDILQDIKITGTKMTPVKLTTMWSEIKQGAVCSKPKQPR